MTNLTPEQLAEKGLEFVPWTSYDIRWDAVYTWNIDDYEWYRVIRINHNKQTIDFGHAVNRDITMFLSCFKYSLDNGKTWHPCTKTIPIGGRIEHEKRMNK